MLTVKQQVVLLLSCAGLSAGAVDFDLPDEIPEGPFDIRAARMEYTNDTLMASGGVTGRYDNVILFADTVTGNTQTGDVRMDGDILMEYTNDTPIVSNGVTGR